MSALTDAGDRIARVDAVWLHCPLPEGRQHTSDFGRIASFDGVLVTVVTEDGTVGHGEAKAGVGSAANCAALVTLVREELGPILVGQDARQINRLWGRMYNGSRQRYAEQRGRSFPVLGRRGPLLAAMSGVDMALWDRLGKARGLSVLELLGGGCRDRLPAYASGGWADVAAIGAELGAYVSRGYRAVKMRIGAMDGTVEHSLARVREARRALGPEVDIMVDAHGTFSTAEARRFCAGAADLHLRWLEEPVSADNVHGQEEVRRSATIPIAAGESESSCFAFHELVGRHAVDVLQPDLAICGGITEASRIGALAVAAQIELAPHCWGSAFSFVAALTVAFASPAGVFVEVPMGANPLLTELVTDDLLPRDGALSPPRGPGLGLTLAPGFVEKYTRRATS